MKISSHHWVLQVNTETSSMMLPWEQKRGIFCAAPHYHTVWYNQQKEQIWRSSCIVESCKWIKKLWEKSESL
jgi:hypothetical protein